jgi:hypothetical protein
MLSCQLYLIIDHLIVIEPYFLPKVHNFLRGYKNIKQFDNLIVHFSLARLIGMISSRLSGPKKRRNSFFSFRLTALSQEMGPIAVAFHRMRYDIVAVSLADQFISFSTSGNERVARHFSSLFFGPCWGGNLYMVRQAAACFHSDDGWISLSAKELPQHNHRKLASSAAFTHSN